MSKNNLFLLGLLIIAGYLSAPMDCLAGWCCYQSGYNVNINASNQQEAEKYCQDNGYAFADQC